MDILIKKALEKISGKTDEELKQMSMFELLDIYLALEAAVELQREGLYSGLLEE